MRKLSDGEQDFLKEQSREWEPEKLTIIGACQALHVPYPVSHYDLLALGELCDVDGTLLNVETDYPLHTFENCSLCRDYPLAAQRLREARRLYGVGLFWCADPHCDGEAYPASELAHRHNSD